MSKFTELTFYPGEHSGAHEQNQTLTIKVDLDVVNDALLETGKFRDLDYDLRRVEEELEDVRKGRDEQIEDLESELSDKDTEIKNLENELDTAKQAVSEMEEQLREKDEEIATLRDELRDLQADYDRLEECYRSIT